MTTQIKWTKSKEEIRIIHNIAVRASEKLGYAVTDTFMDIDACHCNGCELDLTKLLNADDFNFIHDVGGIRKHINRKTGKLEGFFSPRCSV